MVLRFLCYFSVLFAWAPSMHASGVTVRVIYLLSGKPAAKQPLVLFLGRPSEASTKHISGSTNQSGAIQFSLTEPEPSEVFVLYDNGGLVSCAKNHRLSLAEVMKEGVVIGKGDLEGPPCKGSRKIIERFSASPGEILIFVRELTVWDKLRLY